MARILVIDDTQLIRDLLNDALTSHGYEVLLAETADKGNQHLSQKTPDLIMSDIDLPDVSGLELCKMLRSRTETRNVPIIIMTGSSTDAQVKAFQAGADDFIIKPFKIEEMVERVRAVLRRSQRSAQPPDPAPAPAAAPAAPSAAPSPVAEAPAAGQPQAVVPAAAVLAAPAVPASAAAAWKQGLSKLLLQPHLLAAGEPSPQPVPVFLIALLGLLNAALFFAPGVQMQPLMLVLASLMVWGAATGVLVVACSIYGLSLGWLEGAAMVSWAGFPLLIKFFGAFVLSAATSVSPFSFSAGPALFLEGGSYWLARLDVFELWAAGLLWALLLRKEKGGKAVAWVGTASVWVAAVGLGAILHLKLQ